LDNAAGKSTGECIVIPHDMMKDIVNNVVDAHQSTEIAKHRKHIQAIWRHLERLEQFIDVDGRDAVHIKVGDARISLKRNGDVTIRGGRILIEGHGKVTVKSAADLELKGSKISEN
jgi:hypothetical protein